MAQRFYVSGFIKYLPAYLRLVVLNHTLEKRRGYYVLYTVRDIFVKYSDKLIGLEKDIYYCAYMYTGVNKIKKIKRKSLNKKKNMIFVQAFNRRRQVHYRILS